MKLKTLPLALAAAALLLTGCWQKSLYPFYKDKDVIFDESLLGDWTEVAKDKEKPAKWTFTKGELPNVSRLHIEDGDSRLELDARLFKIGENRYFDFYSRGRSVNEIPAHHLLRVNELGTALKMQILDMGWVKKWVSEHPNALPSVRTPDPENPTDEDKVEFVLAADTERLQKWVLEHQNEEGFWNNVWEVKKVAAPAK